MHNVVISRIENVRRASSASESDESFAWMARMFTADVNGTERFTNVVHKLLKVDVEGMMRWRCRVVPSLDDRYI